MSVEISRDCAKIGKPGYKFVKLFYHGKVGAEFPPVMKAVSDDLIAAGIPPESGKTAHSGHYSNEISFFIKTDAKL